MSDIIYSRFSHIMSKDGEQERWVWMSRMSLAVEKGGDER
jgi:hypothetical protein